MSMVIIRRALEKKLAALSSNIAIAYENVAYTPITGTPYQRAELLPNSPDNSIQGSSVYIERGIFQITAMYPTGAGTAAAGTHAQNVRSHYKRGTSMTESGITVLITNTPKISPAIIDGDRYCIPISIPFQAQVST